MSPHASGCLSIGGREDPNAKKTFLQYWKKFESDRIKTKEKKRRKTAEGRNQFCKSCPGRNWFPLEDWVLATSAVYWCKSSKLVNGKGVPYELMLKELKIRVNSYWQDFRV